jgi:hypothetical protein
MNMMCTWISLGNTELEIGVVRLCVAMLSLDGMRRHAATCFSTSVFLGTIVRRQAIIAALVFGRVSRRGIASAWGRSDRRPDHSR